MIRHDLDRGSYTCRLFSNGENASFMYLAFLSKPTVCRKQARAALSVPHKTSYQKRQSTEAMELQLTKLKWIHKHSADAGRRCCLKAHEHQQQEPNWRSALEICGSNAKSSWNARCMVDMATKTGQMSVPSAAIYHDIQRMYTVVIHTMMLM